VLCLSEFVRDDIVQEKEQRVSEPCRAELRADLLEMVCTVKVKLFVTV